MKPEDPPLQLEVSNFGPIVQANIDLRPLTVFVGPSNTGKSYLAVLIYALHKHFSTDNWMPGRYFVNRRNHVLSLKNIHNLAKLAERISTKITESGTADSLSLPGPIVEMIRASFNSQGDYIGNQIRRCFGLEKSGNLIRNGIRSPAHVVIRRHVNESAHIKYQLTIRSLSNDFKMTVPEDVKIEIGEKGNDYRMHHLRQLTLDMDLPKYENKERLGFMPGNCLRDWSIMFALRLWAL